ncbi:MAG: VTT domain-containing protein [Gammaproteobacteria bacterium]|nr:VTT domain-containing protein [Gammaproteobacteria bacterium]
MSHSVQRRSLRKPMVLLVTVAAMFTLAWYVNNYASLDVLIDQEQRVRQAIAANPWQSFFIGFGIYFVLSLVPGTGGKGVVWGWLFGFWQGVVTVTIGLTIAAMLIFYLSRYLFQEAIERRYTNFLSLMNKHLEKEGAFYLLTLRMAHAPYSIVNPVSGASRVRSWTFFWTTAIGLLPANIIWVYVGLRLPSLGELATTGPEAFIDLPLIVALVGCALLPPVVRFAIARFGIPGDDTHVHDATLQQTQKTAKEIP